MTTPNSGRLISHLPVFYLHLDSFGLRIWSPLPVQPRLSRLVIEVCQYPESISRVPLELFSYGDMHRDMRARDSFDVLDLGFERIAEAFFRINVLREEFVARFDPDDKSCELRHCVAVLPYAPLDML